MSGVRAVVFDLFGTLVPEFPRALWDAHFARMAAVLEVDPARLAEAWRATSIDRQTGRLGDIEGNIRAICERIGHEPTPRHVAGAAAVRLDIYAATFHPVDGALEILGWLKESGFRVGLISMCAPDTPALWRELPIAPYVDEALFSCEVGLRKPEPEIYLLACERLGVAPPESLFVGDGSYGELSGAAAVGMRAVLIRDPAEVDGQIHRPEVEEWAGTAIGSLLEVRDLLGA
ncbi:MAG TPA: HAD family hydrolase [Actinomycetota bacterium]